MLGNLRSRGGVYMFMFRLAAAVAFVVLAPALLAQLAPSNRSPSGKVLITVSARPNHLEIRQGDDLQVEVTLTASPEGAYIPNLFGDFAQTCEIGFSAYVSTPEGKLASDMKSCVSDEIFGGRSARELLKYRYVFLKPGEIRRWRTTITGITKVPAYEVHAEYISGRSQTKIEEIAALPEVHGLMVLGRVDAKPVKVRIR